MSDSPQQVFDVALGVRLRRLRVEAALTQEEVARRLAGYGVMTSRASMTVTENGQRGAGAYELAALSRIYGMALSELLGGLPTPEPVETGPDEATAKAARRLGIQPEAADAAARRLWGRGLSAERDARLGTATRSRADQARRGHVTRHLIEELRGATHASA